MTARQQWTVVLAVVAVLAAGLWAATHFLRDDLFPVSVGSAAPAFSARTLGARPAVKTLADYRGQTVLLNVWATWCEPCRAEMPSIQALHESYGGSGFRVVAVSVDGPGDEERIRAFAREYGLTFEILHDPTGAIQKIYQTTGVPESFVIGPDGVIRKKVIGHADWHSPANRALVARLSGAPARPAAPPRAAPADRPRTTPVGAASPAR